MQQRCDIVEKHWKEKVFRVRFLPQFWQEIAFLERLRLECSLTTTVRHFLFCLDVQKKTVGPADGSSWFQVRTVLYMQAE